MLKHIRLATKEEIEALRKTSDYTQQSTVLAMDQNDGEPDFAVVRQVIEADPIYFGKRTNDVQKAKFIFALEERMAGGGVDQYYFNVLASDTRWQKVIETWGGERVSPESEIRYKKVLL